MRVLGDYIKKVIDNRGKNPKYLEKGKYPVIDNKYIKNFIYPDLNEVTRFISQDIYDNFLRGYVSKDMVLITLVGNGIGNVTMAPSDKVVIIQNTIGLEAKSEVLDKKFLYYYLLYSNEQIKNLNRGSSQPSIKKGDLLALEVNFPDKIIQEKISNILYSIDEKIRINNEINNNLWLYILLFIILFFLYLTLLIKV